MMIFYIYTVYCSGQDTGLEFDGLLDGGHSIVSALVVVPHPERPVHDPRGPHAGRERPDENHHRLSEMGRAGRKAGIFVHGGPGRRFVVRFVERFVGRRRTRRLVALRTNKRVLGARTAILCRAGQPARRDVPITGRKCVC